MLNRFIVIYNRNGKCKIRECDFRDETESVVWTMYPFIEMINKKDVLRSFKSKTEASKFIVNFKDEYDRRIKDVEKEMLNVYTNL